MPMIIPCDYHSEWDCGTRLVSTRAQVDLENGNLIDVESSDEDVEDLDNLDREFITIVEIGDDEFLVSHVEGPDPFGRVEDPGQLRAAYDRATGNAPRSP